MKPFGKLPQGSLLAAMVAASQLGWLPLPALAQDYPPEVNLPGREIASEREELPGPMGDRPVPGTRPLVVDVVVKGTRNQEKALNNIRTKREYEYDPAQLQADVRRLITSQQYRNVRTYLRNVDEGVVVIFELVDRPRINSIEFLGNRGADDKKCLKTVNLKVGEPLNTYEVEEGRRLYDYRRVQADDCIGDLRRQHIRQRWSAQDQGHFQTWLPVGVHARQV
jgi:hypothetical protein